MRFSFLRGGRSGASPAAQLPACVLPPGARFTRLLETNAPEALNVLPPAEEPIWVSTSSTRHALRLDLYTDFGPPDEDKLCNQDAAAYAPLGTPRPGLVVALADGVSNSPYSEFGARLAVAVATNHMASLWGQWPGQELPEPAWFQTAFEQTVTLIRQRLFLLWLRVSSAPGEYLPVGWHPRAFLPAVRQKNVLLTTLILAVVLEGPDGAVWGFYSHVGDGALSFCRGGPKANDLKEIVNVLVCQPETAIDSALGPDVERRCFPRCFYSRLGHEFVVCLSTDGVARAVSPDQLLQHWHSDYARQSGSVARTIIESLKAEMPHAVADNLSLAFVSRSESAENG